MRSTTFDMVAMALMAILVILTTGGILTWRYFSQPGGAEQRGNDAPDDVAPADEDRVLVDR